MTTIVGLHPHLIPNSNNVIQKNKSFQPNPILIKLVQALLSQDQSEILHLSLVRFQDFGEMEFHQKTPLDQ
jgi:hypothetical protein